MLTESQLLTDSYIEAHFLWILNSISNDYIVVTVEIWEKHKLVYVLHRF